MHKTTILVGLTLMFGAANFKASAQSYGSDGYGYDDGRYGDGQIIRCESRDNRWQQCADGRVGAELVRPLSKTPCIRGQTWGSDGRGLWVSGGCRGEFRLYEDRYGYDRYDDRYGNGNVFRCESRDGRSRQCPTSVRGRVVLQRQLSESSCVEGSSWGQYTGGVWVSRGCRGEFAVVPGRRGSWNRWRDRDSGYYGYGDGNGQTVRCESQDQRVHHCSAPIRRGVDLLRQYSRSPCIEGSSWGWDRNGVWVSGGCRAEFNIW